MNTIDFVDAGKGNTEDPCSATLTYEQVRRLDSVLNETVCIDGRGNFPTLEVRLLDLVSAVEQRLHRDGVTVRSVRINGGVASHILAIDDRQPYNDVDLIFAVSLHSARDFERVKSAVLHSLLDILPAGVSRQRISACHMKEAYVHKMVKVADTDRWSLISLSNHLGRNVELKFVDAMRRKFEFSVDSFQILLGSIMQFYRCWHDTDALITADFYPSVVGVSVYGDFHEALHHLHKKLIATRSPEQIRGGGLLKYCNLLVRGYRPCHPASIGQLERYMCSRFFIDFHDVQQQRCKLETYLANHLSDETDDHLRYAYLMVLRQVVADSTVCLMGHERRQILGVIEHLAVMGLMRQRQHQALQTPTSTALSPFYGAVPCVPSLSSSSSCASPPPPPPTTLPQTAPVLLGRASSDAGGGVSGVGMWSSLPAGATIIFATPVFHQTSSVSPSAPSGRPMYHDVTTSQSLRAGSCSSQSSSSSSSSSESSTSSTAGAGVSGAVACASCGEVRYPCSCIGWY